MGNRLDVPVKHRMSEVMLEVLETLCHVAHKPVAERGGKSRRPHKAVERTPLRKLQNEAELVCALRPHRADHADEVGVAQWGHDLCELRRRVCDMRVDTLEGRNTT